jgi:hypothetical protein
MKETEIIGILRTENENLKNWKKSIKSWESTLMK